MVSARSIRAGAAYVELTVRDSQLVKGLSRARARLKAFSAGVSDLGKKLLGISAIAAAPLALASRVFGGFEDQMAEVRAVTGAERHAALSSGASALPEGRRTQCGFAVETEPGIRALLHVFPKDGELYHFPVGEKAMVYVPHLSSQQDVLSCKAPKGL